MTSVSLPPGLLASSVASVTHTQDITTTISVPSFSTIVTASLNVKSFTSVGQGGIPITGQFYITEQ